MPPLPLPTEERRTWRARTGDGAAAGNLAGALGLPPLVASLLAQRGMADAEAARRFLEPSVEHLRDPFELADMDAAADRLARAVQRGERMLVYGDADVDGLSGTALLRHFLRFLGAEPAVYVPNRAYEAYSFNDRGVAAVLEHGASVVISVDNGIGSIEPIARLQAAGVDVIVTDHHLPGEQLPEACAVVNPRRADCPSAFKGLAGVGVAFKVACAVASRLSQGRQRSPAMRQFLGEAMAWVAMGTLSDMVPLTDENRILAARGLRAIPRCSHPGLAALCAVAEVDRERFGPEDVTFRLAPRLNAAARMGRADLAVDLVTTEDPQRARVLATQLDRLNRERQQGDRAMFAEIQGLLDALPADEPVVLESERWPSGLLGLVASRVVQATHRPALLVSWAGGSPAKGSCRSIDGFDLHAALAACGELLESHGGHARAAGFSVRRERFGAFREAFVARWREATRRGLRVPPLEYDGELPLSALTVRLVEQLERLAPFGTGNPSPTLGCRDVTLGAVRRMGADGNHLAVELAQGSCSLRAVSFGSGAQADGLQPGARVDALFVPRLNRFGGRARVELELVDLRGEHDGRAGRDGHRAGERGCADVHGRADSAASRPAANGAEAAGGAGLESTA